MNSVQRSAGWRDDDSDETMVLSRYLLANSGLQEKLEKWRNLLQMYEQGTLDNLKRKKDERGKIDQADQRISNVASSIMYEAVETHFPRLLSLWNPEGWFNLIPRQGTPYGNASYLTGLLQRQLDEAHFYETIYPATKQAVKIGNAIVKTGWNIEFGVIYDRVLAIVNGEPAERFVPRPGITYDGITVDLVPYYNFMPDPAGRSLRECQYVIEEGIVSDDWLEQQADVGIYYDREAINRLRKSKDYAWSGAGGVGNDPKAMNDTRQLTYDVWRKSYRIMSYWEDGRFIALAVPYGTAPRQGIALNPKNQENPFDHREKPYAQLAINVHELELFAPGIMESLRDDQAIDSTMLNMMLDAAIKELRPQTIVATGMQGLDIDLKDLMGYIPGRIIPLKEVPLGGAPLRNFFYEQKPDANGFVMMLPQVRQSIRMESQHKSGQTDYTTGQATIGSNKTKGGVELLTANANIRNSTSMLVMSLGATQLLNQAISLNHQFGKPSDPIYGEFNVKVFQDATADNSQRFQALQYALPLIFKLGGNVQEGLTRILRMSGETGLELLLPKDGTMDANQRQAGIQDLMQQMLSGRGQGAQ